MAAPCSVLAWRMPGTEEPGGLLSMGSHRVRHDRSDLAAAQQYLRWWLGPFQRVIQFSWVSPMYTGGIHVIKLLFVFLLTCLLLLKGCLR